MPKKKKPISIAKSIIRPPVVTVMGHIDHGKTTLLDAIRHADQASHEFGGITQHIGAYQINYQNHPLTFIDTPGHAAFSKIRARGAQVTDLIVLVIAANEGVKPQTKESLSLIQAAKIPFLVAINKIDLPDANPQMVKSQLAEAGVVVEDYGGDIVTVEISAKQKKNLDQLLEMILLLAQMQELTAYPQGSLEAVIIESELDRRRGPLATVLVKNGTLKLGDTIQTNGLQAKVRALFDEHAQAITAASPSQPVEILGFKTIPPVGATLRRLTDQPTSSPSTPPPTPTPSSSPDEKTETQASPSLKIILKADTASSLEAISQNLSDEVIIVSQGIGAVNESDVLLASHLKASLIAFNVPIFASAKKLAQTENITIKTYNIIYKLFEALEAQVLELLEPTLNEEILGEAKISAEFTIKDVRIAGCQVTKGTIHKKNKIHLQRNQEIIADASIKSLRQGKLDVDSVKASQDCGLTFKPKLDFQTGDVLISYRPIN